MKKNLTLPLPAEEFIPHRLPMRLVDRLLSYGEAAGVVEAIIHPDCILTDKDGHLDEAAFVELVAQSYALIKGYDDTLNNKEVSEGYLVGAKKIRITGHASTGDRLLIRINTIGSFEGFAVAEGEISKGEEIVAGGTIKLWIVDGERSQ